MEIRDQAQEVKMFVEKVATAFDRTTNISYALRNVASGLRGLDFTNTSLNAAQTT